jgi:hypothetical protein
MAMNRSRRRIILFVSSVLCGLTGCGGSGDRPTLGLVRGVVTLDEKPLQGVLVAFYPAQGRCSGGYTDAEGRYELTYLQKIKGAKLGQHSVQITTDTDPAAHPRSALPKVQIPSQYNTATTLSADVQAGENVFDFRLTSDRKRP